MKKNIKYILGILLSSVLVVTGCGSSSSSNPVASNSISSGLVNVSGNVKNSNGNGTVSFYTPSAVYLSNLESNNLRASVANNEIYTFNIDGEGNYSGQIPAGEYYVIAQNSDGSMKYASARQSFVSSARAEANNEQTVNIELVPTITISGILQPDMSPLETKNVNVYIENMPFVGLNLELDTNKGDYPFTINSVPLAASYTISSNYLSYDNYRYRCSYTTTEADITNAKSSKKIEGLVISNCEPISLSGGNIKGQLVSLSGKDLSETRVIAVTTSEVYTAITENEGKFVLPIDSLNDVTNWFYDDFKFIDNKNVSEKDGLITIICD